MEGFLGLGLVGLFLLVVVFFALFWYGLAVLAYRRLRSIEHALWAIRSAVADLVARNMQPDRQVPQPHDAEPQAERHVFLSALGR